MRVYECYEERGMVRKAGCRLAQTWNGRRLVASTTSVARGYGDT